MTTSVQWVGALMSVATAAVCGPFGPRALAAEQVETFDGGVFANPFFQHDIEYKECCWEIINDAGEWKLHFEPNTDLITFDLRDGEEVFSFSVDIEDYEGGFVGNQPTSAVVVRAASGDFALLLAERIGQRTRLEADITTPGKLTGEPLGEIVSVMFSAANEGNNVIPEKYGANFDNLRVVTVGGVPCEAVRRLTGKCKPSGRLTAKVKLTSRDYDGRTLTIGINDEPVELSIGGRKARHRACCFEGATELTLIAPGACVEPVVADCG